MRKTIVPVAIVLAASAVPMQAQELTYDAIQEEISAVYSFDDVQKKIAAVSVAISSYPKALQKEYGDQLGEQASALNKANEDSKLTEDEKKEAFANIFSAVAQIEYNAKEKEAEYANARKAALQAIEDVNGEKGAYSTAEDAISALEVPSVRTDYAARLLALEKPDEPTAAELYESIDLSNSTINAWGGYKNLIDDLINNPETGATSANQAEMAAQNGRKTELDRLIGAAMDKAAKDKEESLWNLVDSYVAYTGKDGHLATINGVTTELTTISGNVGKSLEGWNLTESEYESYKDKITEQETTLTETAEAAEKAAKAKAKEFADAKVLGLTKYTVFGPDDYTTAAKEDANAYINAAIAAAEKLGEMYVYVPDEYAALEGDVNIKVGEAKDAIAAVAPLENNYNAYADLKRTYKTLKDAYDAAAIELSGLKAKEEIDDTFYNEANTKLNEVAKMLETFDATNQSKYEANDYKGYTESEPGDVYNGVKALLKDAYDTAEKIQQIVEDAKGYNDTLATIEDYRTRANEAVVTVAFSKENEQYVTKYSEQATTLNNKLGTQKETVLKAIQNLENDFRENKVLNTDLDSKVSSAVTTLEGAAATASADLNAYVSSKEQVATWTASISDILTKIPKQDYQGYDYTDLEGDRTLATQYQGEISQLDTEADNAFNASPGSSKTVWEKIQGKTYTDDLETLSDNVDAHLAAYQKWLGGQGDEAIYKLGLQYCEELQAALEAAKNATGDDALGFKEDGDDIKALKDEVDKHKAAGHGPNDCVAAMGAWYEKYVSIQASIETHKKAWKVYDAQKTLLSEIPTSEASEKNLYANLNDTNKAEIGKAISTAQSELDAAYTEAYTEQKALSFDAAGKRTEILNLIAQLKLQEELDAPGIDIAGAISTVRTQLATEGWNPENFYGKQLGDLKTEYDTFTDGVQYYKDYETKSAEIATLKKAVDDVAENAEANYNAYTTQTNAQTAAKAVWADIYSKVGAMYVETDFSGAQKFYQDQLNKCFTDVLTYYDTQIEKAYKTGTSKEFNTEKYNDDIAENTVAMNAIQTAAQANKNAYDSQMVEFAKLETYYGEQIKALETQIKNVEESINGATAEELASLEAQQMALKNVKTQLGEVQTNIDNLKKAIVKAVNAVDAGGSDAYADDYVKEDTNIRSQITKIITSAGQEQEAYTALLEKQAAVAKELEAVKTTIRDSKFADDLNTTFEKDINRITNSLSAAATKINIDHANNLCGKEDAYSLEDLDGISSEISTLSANVNAEIVKLANEAAYNTASAEIESLKSTLDAQLFLAQEQNPDVYTLFDAEVEDLRSKIDDLQYELNTAFGIAKNEGRDLAELVTLDYAEYYTQIATLMGEISTCQAQFEDLKSDIAEMEADFAAIKISAYAAGDEKVIEAKAAIVTAIDEIKTKMQKANFVLDNTNKTVQALINAVQVMIADANGQIAKFKELVADTYVSGDIDGSGAVDSDDVFQILDLVLNQTQSGDDVLKAADMDGDGKYTVVDFVQINNLYVFGKTTGLQGSNSVAAAADAETGSVDMQLDTDRMSVLLDSNTGYSAIQMDVEMPQGVSINEVNFAGDSQKVMVATNTLENGVQRIVIYSSDGSSILNGESSLLDLSLAGEGMGIVSIDHIIAATPRGQRHDLTAATGAFTIVTGIEAAEASADTTSVFDINGMVRKTVQKGINIVKDATGKVKKMLMK